MTGMTNLGTTSIWGVALGELDGNRMALVSSLVRDVDLDGLIKALDRLRSLETVGPMMDPTAWLDGSRYARGRAFQAVLEASISLRMAIDAAVAVDEKPQGGGR